MECPFCTTTLPDDDVFCEACGKPLGQRVEQASPAVCCPNCGAPPDEIADDGYCDRCGHLARRPASDHVEIALSPDFAGVSDRGRKHQRNEDRFAIGQAGDGYIMVVCDGVSSSTQSELASSAVAEHVSQRSKLLCGVVPHPVRKYGPGSDSGSPVNARRDRCRQPRSSLHHRGSRSRQRHGCKHRVGGRQPRLLDRLWWRTSPIDCRSFLDQRSCRQRHGHDGGGGPFAERARNHALARRGCRRQCAARSRAFQDSRSGASAALHRWLVELCAGAGSRRACWRAQMPLSMLRVA